MAEALTSQWLFTAPFEGSVDHMYLDTKGLVTCGVGFMLPTLAAAQRLPWRPPGQVANDWAALKHLPAGKAAGFYRSHTHCRLLEADIQHEFDERVAQMRRQLWRIWPSWASFPVPAQIALTDMAFNMGAGALRRHWPKLFAAVQRRDWTAAGKQSVRKGVQPARNALTLAAFVAAAQAE